ncbi:hypothetical protein ANO14919_106200 [Xylariales sp. No.14919]|nr:hypothetical protein ANO14919_106200 [Xylariales sp. No.14919]
METQFEFDYNFEDQHTSYNIPTTGSMPETYHIISQWALHRPHRPFGHIQHLPTAFMTIAAITDTTAVLVHNQSGNVASLTFYMIPREVDKTGTIPTRHSFIRGCQQ